MAAGTASSSSAGGAKALQPAGLSPGDATRTACSATLGGAFTREWALVTATAEPCNSVGSESQSSVLWAALSRGRGHLLSSEAESSVTDAVPQLQEPPGPAVSLAASPGTPATHIPGCGGSRFSCLPSLPALPAALAAALAGRTEPAPASLLPRAQTCLEGGGRAGREGETEAGRRCPSSSQEHAAQGARERHTSPGATPSACTTPFQVFGDCPASRAQRCHGVSVGDTILGVLCARESVPLRLHLPPIPRYPFESLCTSIQPLTPH